MWDCYGGETQQWLYMKSDQFMYLPSDTKSFKCMDLLGGDATAGNQLGLWDCNGLERQEWDYDEGSGKIYFWNHKCLEIGGEHAGDPLVISDCTDGEPRQTWLVASSLSAAVV